MDDHMEAKNNKSEGGADAKFEREHAEHEAETAKRAMLELKKAQKTSVSCAKDGDVDGTIDAMHRIEELTLEIANSSDSALAYANAAKEASVLPPAAIISTSVAIKRKRGDLSVIEDPKWAF
jgi:hypothetical protein